MADADRGGGARPIGRVAGYFTQVLAVADAEVRKLRHDPSELMTRALQPAIWLLLFGQVMAQVRGLGPQHGRYLDFLAPGILAQSVLFSAIFYGIAAIWERDLGVLHRYMVEPGAAHRAGARQGRFVGRARPFAGGHRLSARRSRWASAFRSRRSIFSAWRR